MIPKAEQQRTDELLDNILKFWRHVFGGERDLLQIFTAKRDSDGTIDRATIKFEFFAYPKKAEAAAKWALEKSEEGREVYQCSHLLTEPRRVKENAAAVHSLWGDLDGAEVPNGELKPTAVVESSPGRYHAYWRLTDAIPADIAEQLNRRLAHKIDADPSGFDRTQLLRVPETTNYKYPDHPRVRILETEGSRAYPPKQLEEILPTFEEPEAAHEPADDSEEPPVVLDAEALKEWRGEKPKLKDDGKIDRSASLLKIGRVLFDAGATGSTVVQALRERDEALGWECYTGRSDGDKQYQNIVDVLEREGRRAKIKVGGKSVSSEDDKKSSSKGEGKPNQIDLANRYIAREPDVAYGVGSWRRYGQGVWAEIDVVEVEKGVLGVLKEAIPEGITPSSVLLSSVVNLLRVEVHIPSYMWADSERGIIVCQNGTLEIGGRNFREHRRDDYALFSVAFDYDPDAKAEIWEAAFKERLGDSWTFLQEYAGYSLTTRTDLEASAFLVGPPGCGKSTFIEGLETVAGDQAGTLSLSDIERSHYALSNIPGKTLLTATEAPNAYLKSTAILDAIVSGEMIQIEKKYQHPERVRPVAKILWAMNELPQIRNPNAGIFRRAQIVPFPEVERRRNPLVKEFIKSEGAGILNWALDGLDRLNAQRWFSISDDMSEATEGFKAGNDIPQTFVDECCKVEPDVREESNLLYTKYREWCLDNGYKPLASNRMKVEWERLGFKHKKIRGRPYYDGVQLIEAPRFIP